MNFQLVLVLAFAAIPEFTRAVSNVVITQNGYQGIVIAFASHITHDVGEPLVQHIKDLFTNASSSLYKATRNRAYFQEVTILVPQSWPRRSEYETAASEAFNTADIRVDDPHPQYGDGPYTLQDTGCGSPGIFIHLTPDYLQELDGKSRQRFGDPGKTLVHEWAHYRYGIFNEFGDPDLPDYFPMFYPNEDEELVPNACTNGDVEGERRNLETNEACHGHEEDCVFLPNLEGNDAITASLGSYHFLKNVDMFCDDGEHQYHQPEAPNKHNLLCEGQSTWNVIKECADFHGTNNPPRQIDNLVPSFRIAQQMEATYSLVLDVSTSMEDTGEGGKIPRRQILYDTVKRWLQEEVTLGAAVGIITFSTNSLIEYKIRQIDTEEIRQDIINRIPNKAVGSTAIGKGLRSAIKELHRYRQGPGGIIILVTDGQEVLKPFIEDVMPELVASKARLVAIALHTDGSPNLEVAVKKTGGKMFDIPVGAGTEKLGMAFYEALTYQANEYDLAQKIASKTFNGTETYFTGSFFIDSTIGNDTTVDFSTDVPKDIADVSISGPQFHASMSSASVEDRLVRFKFPLLKEGTYNYTVTRKSEFSEVQVFVTSKSRSKQNKPITTRCWITEDPKSTKQKPKFVILAEVKQGNNPVINAAVMAKVDRPNKKSVMVQLLDNGNGAPDVTHNDGIYSRHFSQFSGKGRYAVSAQVTDDGKASIQNVGFTGSRSMPIPQEFHGIKNVTTTDTGKFEREAEGGAFTVEEDIFEDTVDLFPPNRISDLRVVNVSSDRSSATLQWTAPGDDLDYGNASSYDIRYDSNWTLLHTKFHQAKPANTTNNFPLPAGSLETYILCLRHINPNVSVFVAIQTRDKAGQVSKTSNIVQVSRPAPDIMRHTTTTPRTDVTTEYNFTVTEKPITTTTSRPDVTTEYYLNMTAKPITTTTPRPDVTTEYYLNMTAKPITTTTPRPDVTTEYYLNMTAKPITTTTPRPDVTTEYYLNMTAKPITTTTPRPDVTTEYYLNMTAKPITTTTPRPDVTTEYYLNMTTPKPTSTTTYLPNPDQNGTITKPEESNFKITILTIRKVIVEGRWIPDWVKDLIRTSNSTTIIDG